jgi:hypothetical protein
MSFETRRFGILNLYAGCAGYLPISFFRVPPPNLFGGVFVRGPPAADPRAPRKDRFNPSVSTGRSYQSAHPPRSWAATVHVCPSSKLPVRGVRPRAPRKSWFTSSVSTGHSCQPLQSPDPYPTNHEGLNMGTQPHQLPSHPLPGYCEYTRLSI